jgi:hypothetical protein
MSIYQINKLCYRMVHDLAFREAILSDPETTMATLALTDEERDLLRAGEVGKLYEMGAHPFLLSHISRFALFGVTVKRYSDAMIAVKEEF